MSIQGNPTDGIGMVSINNYVIKITETGQFDLKKHASGTRDNNTAFIYKHRWYISSLLFRSFRAREIIPASDKAHGCGDALAR